MAAHAAVLNVPVTNKEISFGHVQDRHLNTCMCVYFLVAAETESPVFEIATTCVKAHMWSGVY